MAEALKTDIFNKLSSLLVRFLLCLYISRFILYLKSLERKRFRIFLFREIEVAGHTRKTGLPGETGYNYTLLFSSNTPGNDQSQGFSSSYLTPAG